MTMQQLVLNFKRIIPLWKHRKEGLFNKEFQKKIFSSRLNGDSLDPNWDLEKFLKEIIPNDLNLQSDEEVLEYLESMTKN